MNDDLEEFDRITDHLTANERQAIRVTATGGGAKATLVELHIHFHADGRGVIEVDEAEVEEAARQGVIGALRSLVSRAEAANGGASDTLG